MWSYLFGNSSKQKRELPKKAILDLREHIQLLNKKQSHLQSQITIQDANIKKFLSQGNKVMAKNSLKRKKLLEGQLTKIDGQIDSLEQQLYSIENANLNLETMKAMKQGSIAMKQIHSGLDMDKVDEAIDEIREQVELSEEISEVISRPLYINNELDEEELEEELNMLAEEGIHEDIPTEHYANVELPSVPTIEISNQKVSDTGDDQEDEDEKALRELQAEMGL